MIATIVSAINISPLTYKSISFSPDGSIIPQTGPGLIVCGMFIIPIFIASIYAMFRNSRTAKQRDRKQILIALFLFLISFGTQIVTSFVIVAMFNNTSLVPLGNFLTFIFIVAITASILKMKLFGINIISSLAFVVILVVLVFVDILLAKNTQEIIYKTIVFLSVSFIAYQFIKSILTEAKQRNQLEYYSYQLNVANARLKQVDALKTEFISMASHELLTPISAIEGYLSMIVDEHIVKITDPKLNKYITNVYQSSKRLARLVSDLLNVSRIEQGRLLVQKSIVNIEDLVTSVIEELKFKSQTAQVRLTTNYRLPSNKALVYADADKIKEVVVNLCGNSLKYTKPGGQAIVTVDVWPTNTIVQHYGHMADHVQKNQNGNGDGAIQKIVNASYTKMIGDYQIVVSVTDNGVGIAQEDIGKLFQKFSRVGDWTTQAVQGTGLGLYVSRALVEMHHGKIWVESAGVGKGSTFFFSLPFAAYAKQLQQLDAVVPKGKDMKGLSRMGE